MDAYAALVERAVYGLGEEALAIIDQLSSPTGAIFLFSVVTSVRQIGGEWRVVVVSLNLWGGIGKSGALYAVNLN